LIPLESNDDSILHSSKDHEDLSWDRLPATIQKAAKILGYDNKLWDTDKDPEPAKKDWDELSPAERNAASTLQYNKISWERRKAEEPCGVVNHEVIIVDNDDSEPSSINFDEYDWDERHQGAGLQQEDVGC
jgi:hypothetical protein